MLRKRIFLTLTILAMAACHAEAKQEYNDEIKAIAYDYKWTPVTKDAAPKLHAMVEKQAQALGIRKPSIYLYPEADSYQTWHTHHRQNGRLYIGRKLFEDMADGELEALVALHLSHAKIYASRKVAGFLAQTAVLSTILCLACSPIALTLIDCARHKKGFWIDHLEQRFDDFQESKWMISTMAALTAAVIPSIAVDLSSKRKYVQAADIASVSSAEMAKNLISALKKWQKHYEKPSSDHWEPVEDKVKQLHQKTLLLNMYYTVGKLSTSAAVKVKNALCDNRIVRKLDELYSGFPSIDKRIAYLEEHAAQLQS